LQAATDLPDGQISGRFCGGRVQPLLKKDSDFQKSQITLYPQPSTPHEGRIAIVTDAGLDAMDAGGAFDEQRQGGRRSRVVLTPRRWRQVGS
jgi:hypothetical protein